MSGELPDVKIKIELDTADALRALDQIEDRVKRDGLGIQSLAVSGGGDGPKERKQKSQVDKAVKSTTRGVISTLRSAKVPDLFKIGAQAGIAAAAFATEQAGILAGAAAARAPLPGAAAAGMIIKGAGSLAAASAKMAGNAIIPWLEFGAPAATAAGIAVLKRTGTIDEAGGEEFINAMASTIERISNEITELRSIQKGLQAAADNTMNLLKASVGTDQAPGDIFMRNHAAISFDVAAVQSRLDANIKKTFRKKGGEMLVDIVAKQLGGSAPK